MVCYVVLQENDLEQADKYAELAMSADRYNPAGNQKIPLELKQYCLTLMLFLSCLCFVICVSLCLFLTKVFIWIVV